MVKIKLMSIFLILIFLFSFTYGCAPAVMNKVQLQQIELEMTPSFNLPVQIEKPDKPEPVFLDGDFNQTDNMEIVKYFAFHNDEFVKVIQLSQAFDYQQQLVYYCMSIINEEISVNNDLKEMLGRKDSISQHFSDLYINEQNLRLQENYQHEKEKILDRILIFIQTGVILALIL